ncbi:hypothetical protein, partial [Stenotrophomonas maltophilia]|uniref:hypothetical protein n=1 Tax=Stenotrophomonas maltophilia TaxID=40324 RepID=UPI0019D40B63
TGVEPATYALRMRPPSDFEPRQEQIAGEVTSTAKSTPVCAEVAKETKNRFEANSKVHARMPA